MQTARSRNSRRACDVRSHPSSVHDFTKVQCSSHSRISEREISDADISGLSENEAQLYRETLLDRRVLCQFGWIIRKADSGLHSESEVKSETTRADALVRSLTIAPQRGLSSNHPLCGWHMIFG